MEKQDKAPETVEETENWLKKENLPHGNEAMELIEKEETFLRFQKIWKEKENYMKPLAKDVQKAYDEIKM